MKLYLDVDGVINAGEPPWPSSKTERVSGFNVRWSPEMISALKGLDLELNWLTSWESAAPENLAHYIGYGEDAPVAATRDRLWFDSSLTWKFSGLQRLEQSDARFVWIDDELNPNRYYGRPAEEAIAYYQNALLIAPDQREGITPEHIQQIKEYVGE